MDYKKILTVVTIAFAGILLFFTFFSRTLADMHVPMVSLAFSQQGTIRPEAISHGIVQPADTLRVFAPSSGRITQILEPGDSIGRDTVLFTITSDMQTLQDALAQAEHEQSMAELNLDRTRSDLSAAQQRLNQLLAEPLSLPMRPVLNLFEYDLQLEGNATDQDRVRDDIATLELLHAQGVIPLQDITNRENDLIRLEQSREQILQRREQAIIRYENDVERYEESAAGAERSHSAQVQAQRNSITQINFTISSQNMEMERINNRIYELVTQIYDGGVLEVMLEDGVPSNQRVLGIMPGISIGSFVQEGAPVFETAVNNNRFIVEASFPQVEDFIDVGQSVDIQVGTERLDGTTTRVIPTGGRNTVTIAVQSGSLRGGESVMLTVSGSLSSHANVIPLSAIREDMNRGEYILYVEAEPARFGNHYIVRAFQVDAGRSDASNVAISSRGFGLDLPEGPIIINSDIPVQPGTRVRLADGNDFDWTR